MEIVINNLENKYLSALTRKSYYNSLALKSSNESFKKHCLKQADKYVLRMKTLSETIELIKKNTK